MTTPRKRKPSRLVTTAFPRVPKTVSMLYGVPLDEAAHEVLKMHFDMVEKDSRAMKEAIGKNANGLTQLTAALDAQRVRLDRIEAQVTQAVLERMDLALRIRALESRAPWYTRLLRAIKP